jgi:hypothetical protein
MSKAENLSSHWPYCACIYPFEKGGVSKVTSGMDGHFWFRSHDVRAAAVASGDRSQFLPSPANRAYTVRGSYFFSLLCPRPRIYLPIDPTVHVYIPTNNCLYKNYQKTLNVQNVSAKIRCYRFFSFFYIYGLYILFFVWTIGLSDYRTPESSELPFFL